MEHEGITGVFEGGGVRGVAVAGAAAAALDAGITFDRTIGTSAGALVGSLVAAGYTAAELSKTVCSVTWPDLLDPVRGASIPLIGKHLALVFRKGVFKGDRLERIWADLLAKKGVRVFGDLLAGALSVIVTDLNHTRGLSLPEALPRYGIDPTTFPVARAIRMSAAIPFLFTPVPLYDRVRHETVLIADGAMAANYPLGLADPSTRIIGFRLVGDDREHPHQKIAGPASLARAVVLSGIRARYSLPRYFIADSDAIQVPVTADLDFDMDGDEARAAFDRAYQAAQIQLRDLNLGLSQTPGQAY